MSTTSIKLSESTKIRASQAAQQLGMSTHAFMVSAIEQATTATEEYKQWLSQAEAARQQTLDSGLGYDAVDVHAYIKARMADQQAARPPHRRINPA